jgi:hypothetical protein
MALLSRKSAAQRRAHRVVQHSKHRRDALAASRYSAECADRSPRARVVIGAASTQKIWLAV